MTKQDVIMAVLATCSKARETMIKEGKPDAGAYQQIDRVERRCLMDLQEAEAVELSQGQGLGAVIPGAPVFPVGDITIKRVEDVGLGGVGRG